MSKSKTPAVAAKKSSAVAVATPVNFSKEMKIAGKTFKTKAVTLPVIKLEPGKPVAVRFESLIRVGQERAERKGQDGNVMKPADVATVTDIETGQVGIIILGAALKGEIENAYPDGSYNGKLFAIMNHGKVAGKRYNAYEVHELEE